ncbi:MAG: cytochrome c-type biogenesis protein CcmH [Pelagibacteraceae bacterium]|nr:cytochrome c-type biogenesis protein CcmH [Pelagibacteraceae bacterium]|tara:strand:- start:33489 stop:33878 length:390 start_codon:yes stop_codon:yes gene_type:complete
MKKSNLFYKIILSLTLFFIIPSNIAADEKNIEKKVKLLTQKLRCMTCQNQSIYDSDSDFAVKISNIIKDKFQEGKSEDEIIFFLTKRYGEYILFQPLFNMKNLLLWGFPFILLVISIIFFAIRIKKRTS